MKIDTKKIRAVDKSTSYDRFGEMCRGCPGCHASPMLNTGIQWSHAEPDFGVVHLVVTKERSVYIGYWRNLTRWISRGLKELSHIVECQQFTFISSFVYIR